MKPFALLQSLNENFTAKVFVYLMSTVLLLSGVFNYFFIRQQQRNTEETMLREGSMLAEVLAHSTRLGIFAGNKDQIVREIQAALNVKGVLRVCVLDADLALMAQVKKGGPTADDPCLGNNTAGFLEEVIREGATKHVASQDEIEFWAPVLTRSRAGAADREELYFANTPVASQQSNMLGLLGVTMDRTPLRAALRAILLKNLAILLGFLGLGGLITYFIVREVTGPLNQLAGEVKAFGINLPQGDRVRHLSSTFHDMVGQLGTAFATINELRHGLEAKIVELEQEMVGRRRTEIALRQSEATAQALLNTPVNAAALLDGDGVILGANTAMVGRLGRKQTKELIGERLTNLLAPARQESFRQQIETAGRTGKITRFDDEVVDDFFDNVVYPIVDQDGLASRIVVLSHDITERKKAEKERQELEVRALAQARLASLGVISTGLAHEINQPLSYIKIIYESTLRDLEENRLDPAELREDFQEALRQVNRITLLTDHLRTFGRPGQMIFDAVYLPDIIDKSMILLGESMRRHNITLKRDESPDLPPVNGSANKLEQVFINLLQNSMDALVGRSAGEINIRMRSADRFVTMELSDNGPGIPAYVLSKIFEPFFTTKEVGKGTGLGLSIVYDIVTKNHHGDITVDSQLGQGTTFTVKIPFGKEG